MGTEAWPALAWLELGCAVLCGLREARRPGLVRSGPAQLGPRSHSRGLPLVPPFPPTPAVCSARVAAAGAADAERVTTCGRAPAALGASARPATTTALGQRYPGEPGGGLRRVLGSGADAGSGSAVFRGEQGGSAAVLGAFPAELCSTEVGSS